MPINTIDTNPKAFGGFTATYQKQGGGGIRVAVTNATANSDNTNVTFQDNSAGDRIVIQEAGSYLIWHGMGFRSPTVSTVAVFQYNSFVKLNGTQMDFAGAYASGDNVIEDVSAEGFTHEELSVGDYISQDIIIVSPSATTISKIYLMIQKIS